MGFEVFRRPPHSRKGGAGGRVKLTEADVVKIRVAYALGGTTQRELATRYGVSQRNISAIVNYKTWTHVERKDS